MQQMRVQSLGQKDPLEKGMASHSSILAWRISGERSLAGYSPWGCKELDTTEQLSKNNHSLISIYYTLGTLLSALPIASYIICTRDLSMLILQIMKFEIQKTEETCWNAVTSELKQPGI